PDSQASAIFVRRFLFLRVAAPSDDEVVRRLRLVLDPGESEAIALALELRADAILVDEADGRAAAAREGLTAIGAIGVLLRAKQRGFVPVVVPLIERLRDEIQFFVSSALLADARRLSGE